ncbi:hypothetical protein Cfor_09806 [Coptotermes formosanus]|uniref:Uncharacterized protein n=1 Tax=Coptotermes formosanus TaxID=36987 RepID=A0A6L2QB26_COPFO|nr:hypothetical protein Cfor_09806 [Coptotermes formosanus]
MVSSVWDSEGILLMEVLGRGATVKSQKLTNLKDLGNQVLLLYDARRHTNLGTRDAFGTMAWNLLHHPPYSLDLAPPPPADLHLLAPRRMHSEDAVLRMMVVQDSFYFHSLRVKSNLESSAIWAGVVYSGTGSSKKKLPICIAYNFGRKT